MAYYTISKNSGICLNEQKTDFNTKVHHVAKFESDVAAQAWIDKNGHLFKSVTTGKPVKLRINKHVDRGIVQFINNWKLSKALLASKTGMSAYTLKMKLLGTNPQYKLTEADEEKLKNVIRELIAEGEIVATCNKINLVKQKSFRNLE